MSSLNIFDWIGGKSNKSSNRKHYSVNESLLKKCNNIMVNDNKSHKDYSDCKQFFKSFLTGFEPAFDFEKWSKPIVEGSHNCYVYFLDDIVNYTFEQCEIICKKNNNCHKKDSECARLKPQPGKYAFYNNLRNNINDKFTCKSMLKGIKDDNPSIKVLNKFEEKCPRGFYKGALVIDTNDTYHFYRQDNDGLWSHKPGTLPITKKDANGNLIYVPHLSDMNYNKLRNGGIEYDKFCNYLCVPSNRIIDTKAR